MLDMYKEKNPLTVCLIGVMNGNKVLLAKRKRDPYSGYWGLLGGRQTFGQRIQDVARTEVMRETGFLIKDKIMINGVYSEILLDVEDNPKDHFLFVVVKAHLEKSFKRSKETENTDIEGFKWFDFPLSEEDAKRVIPTDLIMIDNFKSDKLVFKEFVMKEEGKKLKIVNVM